MGVGVLVIVNHLTRAEPSLSWLVGAVWHICSLYQKVFSPLLDNLMAHKRGLTFLRQDIVRIRLGGLGWARSWVGSEHHTGGLQELPLDLGKDWPGSGCHIHPMLHGREQLLKTQLLLCIL